MIINLTHVNTHPRKDGGVKKIDLDKLKGTIDFDKLNDVFMVEIVDLNNPEFQVIAAITKKELSDAEREQ